MNNVFFKFKLLNEFIDGEKVEKTLVDERTEAEFVFKETNIGACNINLIHIYFDNDAPCNIYTDYGSFNKETNSTQYYKQKQFTPLQLLRFLNCIELNQRKSI